MYIEGLAFVGRFVLIEGFTVDRTNLYNII